MMPMEPFDLVIFGGTGDLAMRKLIPAMYGLHFGDQLPAVGRVLAVGSRDISRDDYLKLVEEKVSEHIEPEMLGQPAWQTFLERLDYLSMDASKPASYLALKDRLTDRECRTIYYLSTGASLFTSICENLATQSLVKDTSRIALEKPLGHDLASAKAINRTIAASFREDQIYRIDHYLGKEPVQNLMTLRFGNILFEPLWRSGIIRDVQITVAEQLGMEGRGKSYAESGALRDMVQNHLLQLLSIIAMEPPSSLDGDAVRDEKLKVLRSLHPLRGTEALQNAVRGQYVAGTVEGESVPGFHQEEGIDPDSRTETFVAIRAEIESWRWAGVPFYLRTGKRLQERVSEIVINFAPVPHNVFVNDQQQAPPNKLIIRLQPDEGVTLSILSKKAGDEFRLQPVDLELDLSNAYRGKYKNAYQRLLHDVLCGNLSLFVRSDEMEAAWAWIDPIQEAWQNDSQLPHSYKAGHWGPIKAVELLSRSGHSWHEYSA